MPGTLWTRTLGRVLGVALALVVAAPAVGTAADDVTPSGLKAAFLFNLAKFADWSAVQPSGSIVICVANDDQVGAALADSVRGQTIDGHGLEVRRIKPDGALAPCHLVFVESSDARQMLAKIGRDLAVVTVSDAPGFAESGGMIELFQDGGRMGFAVNVDVAQHSGVRLSSRLLDLARIVRTNHGQ